MTTTEARARCATLTVLPWDATAIADEVRHATAVFLAASPQVTPVAGAPGLWWVGAAGLEALGGERALAAALLHRARRWHPRARVAIADSCVAARAGTWELTGRRPEAANAPHAPETPPPPLRPPARASGLPPDSRSRTPSPIVIVPPGQCAAYLANVPLGLLPMDEELRETLKALGIRTAGAFAAFSAEDVERRWGNTGLAAWRLAHGEDQRRPLLARADAPRSASADLTPSVTVMQPVLFLVRAALDRLVRELVADGRAAATVSITLTLDDPRSALPGGSPAHTITREVRLARPLARPVPLLERCRALLDRWTLSAPVCGVTVAISATAPLTGEQGDLLDPSWRDPAAADAAFARLRAELGPDAVVFPVVRDEHRPERAGAWVGIETPDDEPPMPGRDQPHREPHRGTRDSRKPGVLRHQRIVEIDRVGRSTNPSPGDGSLSYLARALRQLEPPESVEVECEDGAPRVLWWRGRRVRIERTIGPERLSGDWWKDGYARDYWRCEEAEGEGDLVLFRDGAAAEGGWYVQGWYD
jgi:protein ImuB